MLSLAGGRFGNCCTRCIQPSSKQKKKIMSNLRFNSETSFILFQAVETRSCSNVKVPNSKTYMKQSEPVLFRCLITNRHNVRNIFTAINKIARPLKTDFLASKVLINGYQSRDASTMGRLLGTVGKFLRIRYLILTGAIGGGVAVNQTYDNWKQYMPDLEWIKGYLPETGALERIKGQFNHTRELVSKFKMVDLSQLKAKLPTAREMNDWLDENKRDISSMFSEDSGISTDTSSKLLPRVGINPRIGNPFGEKAAKSDEKSRQESLNDEIMKIQTKYQKEVDRLEKENRDLKKQLNLMEQKTGKKRKMNTSLIDMYSEILDVLSGFDSTYNTQDHLPRVVVVGDQSAGKTSVLEMVARARIFPRGSGEMMTRSPVKVTLSEGPFHIAQFKDSSREFDLTKEEDTEALRREVEHRMKKSVSKGQTVSSECISMTVKGPGIQRMVLVDLPGIISTETTVMAKDTKESIKRLVKSYMENPNAIILCIQDGSLDAERSNVTDVVSQIDPSGKRTIFVLTKVDLAESNLYNPNRIKSILEGKLFPMKALGYFAVVTGKGNSNDSIETIRDYENEFFKKSKLLKEGALKHTQVSTQNLSMAVSELFWKMVKENIEQQADAFKATRYNLETEWKNNFPRLRELDRDELFEKAKGEILDEVVSLGAVSAKQWEELFYRKLWEKAATYVFENIYVPAAQAGTIGEFNTMVDIKLTEWASHALPKKSVEVGWDVLHQEFSRLVEKDTKRGSELDEVFNKLKIAVIDSSKSTHHWDPKAEESLRVIQRNILEDRSVHDKQQWDASIAFMEETLKEQLRRNQETLKDLTGPGTWEQWWHWRHKTTEHRNRIATKHELEKLLKPQTTHRPSLSQDEVTTVRQTLQSQGLEVDTEFIKETWYHVFRERFILKSLQQCADCKKGFYHYQNAIPNSGLDCHEVVLFFRLQRMLSVTSNALRQQVVNNEARRLERIIKDVLDDFGEDTDRLKRLLTGRPVELAEELKKVRQIQEKLEEFIEALNREK
ncbi:dynamin-like 120 kDa protein, mitochondrial isoform X2 [Dreissena polymorpha]|uniref:dynamin-like 120 kDa protein, mitochondrial isoform X2 n=1 Tax=Dreissena polymorpha TaxID=45954 RepID=UPI002264B755|nr:dynamin-like 120 kDa protein, mitochondrial isoform X2 [Dreissena polymorpha]